MPPSTLRAPSVLLVSAQLFHGGGLDPVSVTFKKVVEFLSKQVATGAGGRIFASLDVEMLDTMPKLGGLFY